MMDRKSLSDWLDESVEIFEGTNVGDLLVALRARVAALEAENGRLKSRGIEDLREENERLRRAVEIVREAQDVLAAELRREIHRSLRVADGEES